MILVPFTSAFAVIFPNKNTMINFLELLLLLNLTILHAVSYHSSKNTFHTFANLLISLAFIHFCIIILYHFLTYTCQCRIDRVFQVAKDKLVSYLRLFNNHSVNVALLNIPDCTYNYYEYRDGLISDDFIINA